MHVPATNRQLRNVLAFSFSYLAFSAIVIVAGKNFEFLLYLAVMAVIITAVIGVHRRAGLSPVLLWHFSFWGILHMIGGLVEIPEPWHAPGTSGVVYNWRLIPGYLRYDQLVHGYGVGLVTWLCWQGLSRRVRSHDGSQLEPTLGMLSVCATVGMGFGALNEVIEFIAVLILPETNVGDYRNTGWDLVSNLVGAITAALVIAVIRLRRGQMKSTVPDRESVEIDTDLNES